MHGEILIAFFMLHQSREVDANLQCTRICWYLLENFYDFYGIIISRFKVPGMGRTRPQDMKATEPLMRMVLHCIDRIKLFKLGTQVNSIFPLNTLKDSVMLKVSYRTIGMGNTGTDCIS